MDREATTKAVLVGETDTTFTVGGYGVLFGGRDLEGEHFEKETDFWLDRLTRTPPVLYQHGKDDRARKVTLGHATIDDPDDIGLWVEAQIELASEYAQAIRELIDRKVLGWSSGTAGHLAERDGALIKSWPIVEMSLTPTPAEPRTLGVAEIRSLTDWAERLTELLPETEGDSVAEDKAAEAPAETITEPETIAVIKERTMTEEIKGTAVSEDAVADKVFERLSRLLNESPAMQKAFNAMPEGTDHAEEKSFADFIISVQRHDTKRIEKVYKTALSEESGAVGGYLVPVEYANQILRLAAERSIVRTQNPTIVNMTTREFDFPALDHTGSTAGIDNRLGGVVATWTEEAGEKTETEPRFKNVKLIYHELSGYTLASAQVRMDAGPMLESLLRELFADAIAFTEDMAFLNGDGVGKPLGVLKSGVLLSEVAASSSLINADLLAMLELFLPTRPGAGVWFAHPKTLSKLAIIADGSGAANNFIWATDAAAPIPTMLYGKPLIFTDRMPVLPAGTSATQIGGMLLADWSQYIIGDRAGLQIDFSEHYKFINNQGTWRFAKYVDGQPKLGSPMYLVDGTNQVSPFVSLKGA